MWVARAVDGVILSTRMASRPPLAWNNRVRSQGLSILNWLNCQDRHGLSFWRPMSACLQGCHFFVDKARSLCLSTLDENYPEATRTALGVL
jgi:hypothetical protein